MKKILEGIVTIDISMKKILEGIVTIAEYWVKK